MASQPLKEPLSIYEVHAESWRLGLGWKGLADQLVSYADELGFTHVEFMPVMHHPFSGSWGYQVTGFYAPVSTMGEPDDFRALVDALHGAGIGVILDWVPAHFPRDEFALGRFDGTALYEHEDPRRGSHPDWGTLVFNLGRNEVRNFLLANALYWTREFHADGIRVDAVASMLYLDYSRKPGEWVPNAFGGREDLDAVSFLRELNEVLHDREPGILSIAEESTAWPGVSRPDPPRRPRLRLQMEHGLDARHARVLLEGARPSPLPPPRAHLLDGLRLERELRAAALARRSRPRQALAVRPDARRPLAAVREPARSLRLHVGPPGQAALVHGLRVRAGEGVERAGQGPSTGTSSTRPTTTEYST